MISSFSGFEACEGSHRETVHDLRNLFCVIVSAGRLLGKAQASDRSESLLAAIEEAAFRGGQLTENLLAREHDRLTPAIAESASPVISIPSSRVAILQPH